jgi:glycosyltransferase involved in cell wall biosynthesis
MQFQVTALTAYGNEAVVWDLPEHVSELHTIGLWGTEPTAPTLPRRERRRALAGLRVLLDAFLSDPTGPRGDEVEVQRTTDKAWAVLAEAQIAAGLPALLRSSHAVAAVLDSWQRAMDSERLPTDEPLSVADAVMINEHLAHALRPLAAPVAPADLYHAVSNGLSTLPCLAAYFRSGIPFVVSEHGVYLRERLLADNESMPFGVRLMMLGFVRELVSVAYRHASVVAPGNQYNKSWQIRLGAGPEKIVTTYNGVEPAWFPDTTAEPDTPTLAFVGRIDPLKDLHTLIRAFALVRKGTPEAKLRIFGATPVGNEAYRESCVALAQELQLGASVVWEGRVADVADGYCAGNVVVLSSISEGFPYSVIEGMCCARAVVATDVGGVSEAVGEAGIVVPPRDPEAFALAVSSLLDSPEHRSELARLARARVLENFTLETAIGTVRSVYFQVSDSRVEPVPVAEEPRRAKLGVTPGMVWLPAPPRMVQVRT